VELLKHLLGSRAGKEATLETFSLLLSVVAGSSDEMKEKATKFVLGNIKEDKKGAYVEDLYREDDGEPLSSLLLSSSPFLLFSFSPSLLLSFSSYFSLLTSPHPVIPLSSPLLLPPPSSSLLPPPPSSLHPPPSTLLPP
jgi:hypothetical protein